MKAHRYPLAPLMALTGWSLNRVTEISPCNGEEYRRRRDEGVTELIAERLAVAAGLHAYNVWPEMIAEAYRTCARDGCEQVFVPTRRTHSYCSKRCSKMVWARTEQGKRSLRQAHRKWRDAVPDYARRVDREVGARWRAENRERKRAQDRDYYQRTAERQKADRRARYQAKRDAERVAA